MTKPARRGTPGATLTVEFPMPRTTPAPWADQTLIFELLRSAAVGIFPGPLLEAALDRLERR